jgi:hypothetical protein
MIFFDDVLKYVRDQIREEGVTYPDDAIYDAVLHAIDFLSDEGILTEEII